MTTAAFENAAAAQKAITNELLLTRVALQPALDAVNKLPGCESIFDLYARLKNSEIEGHGDGQSLISDVQNDLKDLLVDLIELQVLMVNDNPTVKEAVLASDQEVTADSVDGSPWVQDWKKRRVELTAVCPELATFDEALRKAINGPFSRTLRRWCMGVADSWHKLAADSTTASLQVLGQNPSAVIRRASQQQNEAKLAPSFTTPVIGRSQLAGFDEWHDYRDVDRYDDVELYMTVLAKASRPGAPAELVTALNELEALKKRESGTKRQVDTRASKGRKLRLDKVIDGLVGYMVPAPMEWKVDQSVIDENGNLKEDYISRCYASLFKKNKV